MQSIASHGGPALTSEGLQVLVEQILEEEQKFLSDGYRLLIATKSAPLRLHIRVEILAPPKMVAAKDLLLLGMLDDPQSIRSNTQITVDWCEQQLWGMAAKIQAAQYLQSIAKPDANEKMLAEYESMIGGQEDLLSHEDKYIMEDIEHQQMEAEHIPVDEDGYSLPD